MTDDTCPVCGHPGAYIGLGQHDVECPNPKCRCYSDRQRELWDEEIGEEEDETTDPGGGLIRWFWNPYMNADELELAKQRLADLGLYNV